MSDLRCAATVVVLAEVTERDVERLRAERPAQVYGAGDEQVGAAALAQALAVGCQRLPEDFARPGSLVPALDELADEYRGECLAVVVAPRVLDDLARLVLPEGEAQTRALVVRIDADGHRWAPFSGSTGR